MGSIGNMAFGAAARRKKIQFIVPAGTRAKPFDFCIESVSFMTLNSADASGDASLDGDAAIVDGSQDGD
jgi:hypothetical protein